MNQRITNYLAKLENEVINGSWKLLEVTPKWAEKFNSDAGVYVLKEEGKICFVEESANIKQTMGNLLATGTHSLRKIIGNIKFAGQEGYKKIIHSQEFPPKFETELARIFEDNFEVSAITVLIGRKELEEHLINKYKPKYNLIEKNKLEENQKAYSVAEVRKRHENAYSPWTDKDDDEMERLNKEGKSINELATIFGRNRGAIKSRLKKIHEKKQK